MSSTSSEQVAFQLYRQLPRTIGAWCASGLIAPGQTGPLH